MQGKKAPIIVGQTKQSHQPHQFDESELITIATQVSFDALLNVIKALPITQKWQIYQVLGVELYPQPFWNKIKNQFFVARLCRAAKNWFFIKS